MEGVDKALCILAGRPMVTHVIERLAPQTSSMVINANGAPERFAQYHLPVVCDSFEGHQGPLSGILAVMSYMRDTWAELQAIVTAPCDAPFLPKDLVERLRDSRVAGRIVIGSKHGRLHPTFGLWPLTESDHLRSWLERGERMATAYVEQRNAIAVEFPDVRVGGVMVDPFTNVNTPEELARAERILGQRDTESQNG